MWGIFNTPLPLRTKRSISKINFFGYAKWYDLLFDLKNIHAESIIYLFELKKGYVKWHDPFLDPKNGYEKWHNLFLIIKRIVRNGIFGISVGAYCIRPLKMSPKRTYDQKCRYMWGVFNTPLPWRTKRSIPKIDLRLWEMAWPIFWYGKCSCRTDCFSILIDKGLCEMAQPFFWL